MPLTIARFDLDETPVIPNVPRPVPAVRAVLPTGFPFIVDEVAHEVVEPVLLFLAAKYSGPAAFKEGSWTKLNSANAAAADLKDWWEKARISGVPWDCADDHLVADWLIDMRTIISGKTFDFLSDSTVKRRASSVAEFYRWAHGRKLVEHIPEPDAAKRLANALMLDPKGPAHARGNVGRGKYDREPHPISPKHAAMIADHLGPLPTMKTRGVNRTRLAFELGFETGMRIDEILNLHHALFADFDFDKTQPFVMTSIEITKTKGLVPREINIPAWLMNELNLYVAGERHTALTRARTIWLKGSTPEPWQLFLNHAGSPQHVGKPTQAATLQDEFAASCRTLNITRRKILGKGSAKVQVVMVPRHTFHDTRHSFAVMLFHALESRGRVRPWLRVQKALGHAQISTTTSIYLSVVDHLGAEALERLAETFHAIRNDWRGAVAREVANLKGETV
ncbi:site-specific recombinase XerD [Sphingomonas sp. PP-F2F-A104-K0414]|uniref:tyrosine-type recombinase/integrase n=1 Tax=Sphingomonas sp. PP-F2F-A104-K0414 TaxID=2135661 RepID=UPI001052E800|nr:site-specific integrase [Sphingomonas sp. PP-F2F-A104-K0414]TCP96331.1 site-specific recombinase XerD [Sphingomonas sp. PP-F2F-A104-K0414]